MQHRNAGIIHLLLPFYRQHYDFTCGPACLMMAMKYLDDSLVLSKELEIDIWREANLVAVPGTSRYGLAYSAASRGFSARVASNTGGIDYVEKINPPLDDEAMDLLRSQFSERRMRCRTLGIRESRAPITARTLRTALGRHHVPLIVTSTRFYSSEDLPHWVVMTGIDDGKLSFFNPADPGMRTRTVGHDSLHSFIGYRGDQSMVEVWKE
ncbi:MAG: peptidase C39 family protein [Methanoregula sp.]|jgi:hypothetical protein